MRTQLLSVLAIGLLLAVPAQAGQLSVMDGHTVWQSTQCQMPLEPAGLSSSADALADALNARVTLYNQYLGQVQDYMNCISAESQRDANAASHAIVNAGQQAITQAHDHLATLAQALQNKNQ